MEHQAASSAGGPQDQPLPPEQEHHPTAVLLLGACFFMSGAAGLAYEVAWLRSLELVFGGTSLAAATVLAAFMAGLALGSYTFGLKVRGWARPLRTYAWLEIGIGLYAVLVPFVFSALEPLYGSIWGAVAGDPLLFGIARFILCFTVLLPATLFMGATLPVIAQHWSRWGTSLVGGIGWLYGVNTLGAVVGVVITGFLLLPRLGFSTTIAVAVAVNLGVAATAFYLSWRHEGSAVSLAAQAETDEAAPVVDPPSAEEMNTIVALAFTGFAAMALQVAWTRMLALVVGSSVYAFSIMLATFLVGLGLGSVLFSWVLERGNHKGPRLFWMLAAASGLLSVVSMGFAAELPYLFARLFHLWEANLSSGTMFRIEAIVCGAAIFLPTLFMGGLFPAGLAAAGLSREQVGASVGRLYAGNTVGAVLGAFMSGFFLIPTLGISGTVYGAAFLYIAVGAVFGAGMEGWSMRPAVGRAIAVTSLGLVTMLLVPRWKPAVMTSGIYEYVGSLTEDFTRQEFREYTEESWELLYYKDGPVSTVSVVWRKDELEEFAGEEIPNLVYQTDGKADASSVSDMHTQIMLAQAPMLLHPAPEDVLVIGLASGTTAGSVLTHPIDKLDIVEIEPAAEDAARLFDFVNGRPLDDRRTTLTVADARSYLRGTEGSYDVIISEPSNPWMAGPANLFTQEFFEIGSRALRDGGVFTQWIQLYALTPDLLRTAISTFHSVFPYVYGFHPMRQNDLILVGSQTPIEMNVARLGLRWEIPTVRADLARLGLNEFAAVMGQARLGPDEIADMADGVRINTDDNGLILFNAPLSVHSSTVSQNDELLSAASRGVSDYLRFPGATPEIEGDFLSYLAAAYGASGFYLEAVRAQQLADARREGAGEETNK
jgi:spermidine synthase